MKTTSLRRLRSGFTLMEMMLVLLIITLIIGSVAVLFGGFTNTAQVTTTKGRIRSLESALMGFKTLNGFYPSQAQGLEALVTRPSDPRVKNWTQTVKSEALIDPWEHKIQYRNPGKRNPASYDVFSYGVDGVESEDDLGNW